MAQYQRKKNAAGHESSSTATRFNVKTTSTIMEFLLQQMYGKSRTSVKQLLTGGYIRVNGRTTTNFSQPVNPGDVVEFERSKKNVVKLPAALKIVYEDDHIIVVNKDAGLLSVSSSNNNRQTALVHLSEYVKQHDPSAKVFLVHRVDREISGLMIFAKSTKVHSIMTEKLSGNVLCRRFYALVEGYVQKDNNEISTWINENAKSKKLYVSAQGQGHQAVTSYKIIDGSQFYTILDITAESGRKNQVRVHMKHMGHPITGDVKYGAHHNPINRLALHATELNFVHPVTNKPMSFSTAIPPAFYKAMEQEK